MIHSMTGYAVASAEITGGTLNVELRTVNSRYLDIQFRVADELRMLEPGLREAITARLSRGKVDCRLSFSTTATGPRAQALNMTALEELKKHCVVTLWTDSPRTCEYYYVFADGKTRQSVGVAATPERMADVEAWCEQRTHGHLRRAASRNGCDGNGSGCTALGRDPGPR